MIPMLRNKRFLPNFEDDFFGKDFFPNVFDFENNPTIPEVNVRETKDNYVIEVAAPGLNKKDFNVDLQNNVLTISSEKENKDEDKDENYLRREFSYSKFQRSFSLPEGINADQIKAKHEDGILYVSVPKVEEKKKEESKQIKIE
jgi:HSP20 family protein